MLAIIVVPLACASDDQELLYCSYSFEAESGGTRMEGTLIAVGDGESWAGMMAPEDGAAVPMSASTGDDAVTFSFQVDGDATLSGGGALEVPFGTCPAELSGTMDQGGTWEAHTTPCTPEVEKTCRSCLAGCACTVPCSGLACDACSSCVADCHSGGACAEACSPAP